MDKFLNLPMEKQTCILDAALKSFGSNGYKKASIRDIAATAGISKAMVFHYFGTKKDLYYYLIRYCGDLIMKEIEINFDSNATDFFERIIMSSNIKIAVIKKHPSIMSFLYSAYFETNEEVKDSIQVMLQQSEAFRNKIIFEGMDYSKFKEGIDVQLVMKMLLWLAEGFMKSSEYSQVTLIDKMTLEYYECMNLLRNNFYKEQYL